MTTLRCEECGGGPCQVGLSPPLCNSCTDRLLTKCIFCDKPHGLPKTRPLAKPFMGASEEIVLPICETCSTMEDPPEALR